MNLEPTLLYALIESYLYEREMGPWQGKVKLAEVSVDELEKLALVEKIKNKIICCREVIRAIQRAEADKNPRQLLIELKEIEKKQRQEAGWFNKNPVLVQLLGALSSLVVHLIPQREREEYLLGLKAQDEQLILPTALQKASADTREEALKVEKTKNQLKEEIELFTPNNAYQKFYDEFVGKGMQAKALKEKSWEEFRLNVRNKKRTLPFSEKCFLKLKPVVSAPIPIPCVNETPVKTEVVPRVGTPIPPKHVRPRSTLTTNTLFTHRELRPRRYAGNVTLAQSYTNTSKMG